MHLLCPFQIPGVFQNVLAFLSEPARTQTIRGVLSVLGGVLDIDVSPLLHTLSTTPPPTPPQASQPPSHVFKISSIAHVAHPRAWLYPALPWPLSVLSCIWSHSQVRRNLGMSLLFATVIVFYSCHTTHTEWEDSCEWTGELLTFDLEWTLTFTMIIVLCPILVWACWEHSGCPAAGFRDPHKPLLHGRYIANIHPKWFFITWHSWGKNGTLITHRVFYLVLFARSSPLFCDTLLIW